MSAIESKLIVTYILPREEDPALFDHLISFRKGPTRTARLKTLIRNGFMHERLEGRHAVRLHGQFNDSKARVAGVDPDAAVMDQMFATVER